MDAHTGHHAHLCDGSLHNGVGGSWIGHFLPGIVLFTWGLHWFISVCHCNLAPRFSSKAVAHRDDLEDVDSPAATHRLIFAPIDWYFEAWMKVLLPVVAICLEFTLSGTRSLRCPAGTAKAGELDVQHMNSWSHATNYPPLILSGVVDLLHARHPMPHGVPHAFLSLAFGINAFLMLTHSKVEALDALVHKLLGYCMAGVCVSVAADGVCPRSFVTGAAKSLALMMEGLWFFAVTHIEFSGDVMWRASHAGDMTRVMFTPVLFSWIFIGLLFFMLLLFTSLQAIYSRGSLHHQPTGSSSKHSKRSKAQDVAKYLQLPTIVRQDLQHDSVRNLSASSDDWDGADARLHLQV